MLQWFSACNLPGMQLSSRGERFRIQFSGRQLQSSATQTDIATIIQAVRFRVSVTYKNQLTSVCVGGLMTSVLPGDVLRLLSASAARECDVLLLARLESLLRSSMQLEDLCNVVSFPDEPHGLRY